MLAWVTQHQSSHHFHKIMKKNIRYHVIIERTETMKMTSLPKYPIRPRWLELGAVAWSNDNNLILLLGVIVLIHWTLRKKADDPLMVVKKRRKEEIDSYALELFWRW